MTDIFGQTLNLNYVLLLPEIVLLLSSMLVIAIDAFERRYRNLFVGGMISKTVSNIDELIPAIEKVCR